jgi:hypothetical protein
MKRTKYLDRLERQRQTPLRNFRSASHDEQASFERFCADIDAALFYSRWTA